MAINNALLSLTEREKKYLKKSWAETFSKKIFPFIDEDRFSVGAVEGAGTCGTIYYIGDSPVPSSNSDCRCEWDSGSDECEFVYKFGGTITDNPNFPRCNRGNYSIGECIDGRQSVNWTATITNNQTQLTQDEILKSKCYDGGLQRNCGQALLKLPGFSFLNILLVLAGVVVFYVFVRKT